MNKKLKCLLSAALALIMLMSLAIAMPAAAENAEPAATAVAETEQATVPAQDATEQPINGTNVFDEGSTELQEINSTGEDDEQMPDRGAPELAETGTGEGINAPVNAYRESRYTNRIVIKWHPNTGVDGYRVYWRDMTKQNAEGKLLTTTTGSSVTINNLKMGSKFRFYVHPYIKDGDKYIEGKSSIVTACTIPAPVRNFHLQSAAQSGTVLKWRKTVGIDGYLLLRQHQGVWEEYKYLSPGTTQYKDTDVIPGHAYYYKILTYRSDSRGYLKSSTSLVRTVCGLCAPADTGSTSRVNRIYLSWRDISFATGYQVFYSTDNKTYRGLAVTDDNSYTTKKFKEGQKIWFRIRPYRLVGKSQTKVLGTYSQFAVKVLANSFGADVGNTYIEIDISDQYMWYIINGDIYVSTPVVTGNYNSMDTPTGVFSVKDLARNVSLVGAGYVSFVEYWIPFIGSSYGIHDASWRSSFGGEIYKGNGSHGCVNTPYDAVKKIYNRVSIGTPVVIHK